MDRRTFLKAAVAAPAALRMTGFASEALAQSEFEDWVETKVKEGRSIFGLYPPNAETKAEYESWKKGKR